MGVARLQVASRRKIQRLGRKGELPCGTYLGTVAECARTWELILTASGPGMGSQESLCPCFEGLYQDLFCRKLCRLSQMQV